MPRKKIHRFLVDSPVPDTDTFEIQEERIVHQIGRVLKIHEGEEVALFTDGSGDTIAKVVEVSKEKIVFEKVGKSEPILPTRRVIAAVAIPKGDTFELIVQKLTELGVHTIVPILSERTVKQSVRLERLQAISDEALEQCGGSTRVQILKPIDIQTCRAQLPFPSIVFEPGNSSHISIDPKDTIVMYVGPEGGWSTDDMNLLADAHRVGLGERILRAETAAIVGAYTILTL